jgi:Spy/CpxP family protein refolding chaperone
VHIQLAVEEMHVKPGWMIALLIAGMLVTSASAQERRTAQLTDSVVAGLPRQQSSSTSLPPAQLQEAPGEPDATQYPELMQAVLQGLSEELVQIAQLAHDGNISRPQAEYLSVESYYTALMRFQLLRALYQSAAGAKQGGPSSQANTAPQSSDSTVVVPSPTSQPDLSAQIARYLKLTPAQIAAIEARVTADRERVEPLLEQLDNSRRSLISKTLNGHFDAQQVRALAAEQSRILQQLIEANAELEAKVYSILTSEQQRQVDELRRQTMATMKTRFPEW